MMWSSGSTSKQTLVLVRLGLGALCLGMLTAGCASHQPPAAPALRGTVDLEQLVHSHPGWSGVSQYDAALRRLEQASRQLPQAGQPDQKIAILPALSSSALPDAASAMPVSGDQARNSSRLEAVQRSLLSSLRAHRETARADQVRQNRKVWRDEARAKFPDPSEAMDSQPDLELQLLEANVAALSQTIANWKQAPPPAPEREALRAKVAVEQAKLDSLRAERAAQREAAAARRRDDIQRARAARIAYVQKQGDDLEARLRTDDERLIAAQTQRLTQQRSALLTELSPQTVSPPAAGYAGEETLPHGHGVGQASLSQTSLTAAETRLRAQRARWLAFLYADTQAAALDAAGQRGWKITFGPPRSGDRDMTGAMAQALAASLWRL